MDAAERAQLVRPRELEPFRDADIAEVDGEFVAPHREPLDGLQGLAFRQTQRDVLVAVPRKNVRSGTNLIVIPYPRSSFPVA